MPVPAGGNSDMLATTADLAAVLQVDTNDLDATSASLALEAATAVVQALVSQRLLLVTNETITLTAPRCQDLRLPEQPVTAVATVVANGVTLTLGTASGTYRLTTTGLWRDIGWTTCWSGPTMVAVTYSHGLPLGHQDLQLARGYTASLAAVAYDNPTGATSEKIDDYAVAYQKAAGALEASPFMVANLRRKYGRRGAFVAIC